MTSEYTLPILAQRASMTQCYHLSETVNDFACWANPNPSAIATLGFASQNISDRKRGLFFIERRIAIKNPTTRLTTIGKQKYKVVSHYVGEKDINKVLEELAVRRALFEYNYDGGFKKAV
jgi:hypothetical protein